MPHYAASLRLDRRGATLVEFALLLPLLACLLVGIMSYGLYFLVAHSVQQLANDAARATVAGLSPAERVTLASQSVTSELTTLRSLGSGRATTQVHEANGIVTVTVTYDASNIDLLRNSLVPMPSAVIVRDAVARPGGEA